MRQMKETEAYLVVRGCQAHCSWLLGMLGVVVEQLLDVVELAEQPYIILETEPLNALAQADDVLRVLGIPQLPLFCRHTQIQECALHLIDVVGLEGVEVKCDAHSLDLRLDVVHTQQIL